MILDLASVMVITALVVNVSGVVFIVETLLRRDEGAGRVWALGFLGAMLTTLSYMVWAQTPDAWWSIVMGNASFVAGTGCMWLGCRRFNGRPIRAASLLVAAAVVAAGVSVVVEGPDGGDWAGAIVMFVGLLVFAAAAAFECATGALGGIRTAWALGVVLGFQSIYYVVRTVLFLAAGPDSDLFDAAVGTIPTAFLTVTLTIVAVVVTSVLRATRAPVRGFLRTSGPGGTDDGIMSEPAFTAALADLCGRAPLRSEPVGVIAVRIEDLEQFSTAFGSEIARDVTETWRRGVRRHAPTQAYVGDDGAAGMLVALVAASGPQIHRAADAIYRGLFDELTEAGGGVIPVVGVGLAIGDPRGADADRLVGSARAAASRAARDVETSVLVGDAT